MQLRAADKKADTVYHNGTIYTVTEDFRKPSQLNTPNTVEVVATLNGKIVFVGSESEAKAQGFLNASNVNKILVESPRVTRCCPALSTVMDTFPDKVNSTCSKRI